MAVAAVGLLGWLGYRLANATSICTYRAEFTTLPASDDALRDWLASQPGVSGVSVSRDGQTVVVEFTMPSFGHHAQPNPVRQAEQLGYGGLRRYTVGYTSRW
jgi:hypothetical protein